MRHPVTRPRTALLAGTGAAFALAFGTASAQFGLGDEEDARELAALYDAAVSLAEAVDAVSSQTDARIVAAEFDETGGSYVWEVETLSRDGVERYVRVDATTGEVLESGVDD